MLGEYGGWGQAEQVLILTSAYLPHTSFHYCLAILDSPLGTNLVWGSLEKIGLHNWLQLSFL